MFIYTSRANSPRNFYLQRNSTPAINDQFKTFIFDGQFGVCIDHFRGGPGAGSGNSTRGRRQQTTLLPHFRRVPPQWSVKSQNSQSKI